MGKAILKLAASATEMNGRSYPFSLSKDGLSFTGGEAYRAARKEDGKIDHAQSAKDQFSKAKDLGLIALTPDKALILGAVSGLGDENEKASIGGATVGSILGLLGDVAEAIPAAALAAGHLVKGSYHGVRAFTG
jgi:hypothetical protein